MVRLAKLNFCLCGEASKFELLSVWWG